MDDKSYDFIILLLIVSHVAIINKGFRGKKGFISKIIKSKIVLYAIIQASQ